jgi:hypothetical protein
MPPDAIQNDLHAIDEHIPFFRHLPILGMKIPRVVWGIADTHPVLHEFSALAFGKALKFGLDIVCEPVDDQQDTKPSSPRSSPFSANS